jgi:predicted ATPase
MSDVFISYARGSQDQAHRIAEVLRALDYGVWLDDELPPHRDYSEVIEERLRAAKAVVVVWSAEAMKSQWVKAEADLAREAGTLVQLSLDGAVPPLPFNRIQCANLKGWSGDPAAPGWKKVVASITELAGSPPASTGQPREEASAKPQPGVLSEPALALAPTLTASPGGNLPKGRGALFGRDAELTELVALLNEAPLVTVTGAGGVGKTRIALEVAQALAGDFEDGVWLAELAPVADAEHVAGAVARAMNVELSAGQDPQAALVDRLRLRRCLVILDNCEHVIDAAAGLAEALLDANDGVKLLASSQEPLGVDGEKVFRLRSLGAADAIALFVDRATAVDQDFEVSTSQAAAVAAICKRLDGIPLAIEMAAARAPAVGCGGVLKRLDDRFRLLTGGRRTALPRQRTLQATLDWSHALLSARDAAVFRRLAVFSGGFSLEAASDVATDDAIDLPEAIDAVASLVDKSLVVVEAEEGKIRYRLLETVRAYALEKLAAAGETNATLRRHALFFVKLSQTSGQDYSGLVSDDEFAARYFADIDNIYRALDWAFGSEGELNIGVELAGYSWPIAIFRSMLFEHTAWLDRAYEHLDEAALSPPARAALLMSRAHALTMAAPARAIAAADEAIAAGEAIAEPLIVVGALSGKVSALTSTGRAREAEPVAKALQVRAKLLGRSRISLSATAVEAQRLLTLGDRAAARDLYERVLPDLRAIGAYGDANEVLLGLGGILAHDDPAAATDQFREILANLRSSQFTSGYSTHVAAQSLAMQLLRRDGPGDLEEARALSLTTIRALGPGYVTYGLSAFVVLATRAGNARDGARVAGFDKARHAETAVSPVVLDNDEFSRGVLKTALPEVELAGLMAEGARMSPDEVFRLVIGIA